MTYREPQNSVELIEIAGDDLSHALSAWTSTSRDLTEEKKGRVGDLIHFLVKNFHHTPIEKSYIRFLVVVDDATHVHLLKHRIGVSINGESARYKEYSEDKFYLPEDMPPGYKSLLKERSEEAYKLYRSSRKAIQNSLLAEGLSKQEARKRAKELSRFFLPKNIQITLDISFNWRSFMHFQSLRNSTHAQREVREVAQEMFDLVDRTGKFPNTIAACKLYCAALEMMPFVYDLLRKYGTAKGVKLVKDLLSS